MKQQAKVETNASSFSSVGKKPTKSSIKSIQPYIVLRQIQAISEQFVAAKPLNLDILVALCSLNEISSNL